MLQQQQREEGRSGWWNRAGSASLVVLCLLAGSVLPTFRASAVDYVFVVDTSGSMRERVSRKNPETKIATVQNNLRQHLLALPPDSRLSLISFNTGLKDEREVILRSEADRQAVIEWVNGLERQTRANGSTHLWAALRRGLSVASEYSRQNPNQTVLVRVLTDGMDNDPQYRGRSAEQVLRELQAAFPAVDGETIRANLVLLGDLELDVRTWPGVNISHDPNFTVIFPPVIAWEPLLVHVGTNVVFSEQSRFGYRFFDWWVDGQRVSAQASFTHVFTNAGRHAVRLQVASADGLREADTKTVEVLEAEKPAPLAPG